MLTRLVARGKDVAKQRDIQKALELFKLAYNIHQSTKLQSRISKIEELLAQNDEEDEDDEFVNVNNSGLMLFRELHDKLYDYQRDGVSFLYGLYRDGRKGGILADDMGLGKTIQVISFLSGMYDNELVKHTLLIMPTSLITNWIKEFAKWTPGMRVKEFHGTSKIERTRSLEKVQRRNGVIITTYTMLMNNWQQLSSYRGKEFCWDYVILDEAHKIKNTSTKTTKSAYAIPSKNRILLTGTPVQNNLREMWTLFDFACQGALLGTAKTFKAEYENPITRAREKDATPGEKALGSRMSENLMTLIKPYFLRRTKSEVQKMRLVDKEEHLDNRDIKVQSDPANSGAVMPKLTRKNDLIVWTYLSRIQEDIYTQFIGLDHIKELLLTTRSPLAELNILKKLCDHPRLLSAGAIAKLGLQENGASDSQSENIESDNNSIANVPDENLISESGKLVFLLALLERLREEGHRTLVFAHYRKVLDIIQRILSNRGFKVLRLDGTITQITERERLISLFQKDKRYSVFLLTTQVGGVGITLTAADRVVIYDPSWNPATDAQAVDRAYRIGQTENVIIYRLITCGTVEEKIYRRQVFKDSLIRQNTGDKKNPFRYFSRQELRELFTLEDTRSSSTQLQLQAMHSRHRRTDPELDKHIAHLHTMDMFGISDHDLMFSLDVNHDEALENQEEHHYIEGRVQKAQELMKAESELKMQLVESMATSTEPAWLRQPPETSSREKKPRNLKTSPSHSQPVNHFHMSPVVVDLDQSASGEDICQNLHNGFVDLTAESSPQQDSEPADAAAADVSVGGLRDKSETSRVADSSGREDSLLHITTGDIKENLNGSSRSEMDLNLIPRHSVLQQSNWSFKAETSSKLDSLHGDFNLKLEDSSDDGLEDIETEEEEQKLLSKLQMNGSFDINKSLSESLCRQTVNSCQASVMDESMNESMVVTRKKTAVLIYDSEEEEEEQQMKGQLSNFFQVLGASTPKSAASGSPHHRSRRSLGGNASVVSHRSFIQSIMEDMDDQEEDEGSDGPVVQSEAEEEKAIFLSCNESQPEKKTGEMEEEEEDEQKHVKSVEDMKSILEDEEEKKMESEDDVSELYSEQEEEEEEVIGSTSDELQLEETREEDSANITPAEDMKLILDENKDSEEKEEQDMSVSLEESTGEPELASGERMDQCTVEAGGELSLESESYESLVSRGRECYSQAKLDQALDLFLRAIDIKPGDPEVQFLTIQLYRQLSQRP
ncbi:DNA excision repair protein ERCC-6-like isoform X2 [Melanotaenia boesemani]|uniref:DNA excision repair protein ERCC-6-like isoform X2 n=1 Tax=Melanotaenia boesemani TaxID=1250792 RepID=UPI001C05ACED|nr:DNA excision repair protein ERCC-6-like isoform X2 [Melanotaenia boesemani]